jgi:DNA-binding NarL/FixJ family response regulator
MEVVGEAANGLEAIQENERLHPDLIILDVSMPVVDGLTAAAVIRKDFPHTAILLFSLHDTPALVDAAKQLGLEGFISKEEGDTALIEAIHAVLHKQTYFPSS